MNLLEITEKCMRQVYKDAPLLEKINQKYHDFTLADYIGHLKEKMDASGECDFDPVIGEAIEDYATDLIGKKDVKACINTLKKTRFLYTADHHAIDFHPMSVQGNLLYEYLESLYADTDVVPVFSCSTIPLSNSFYPRGLLIYDTTDGQECRIPVFPFKMRKAVVSHAPAFTPEMLLRAGKSIRGQEASGCLKPSTAAIAMRILDEVYGESGVLSCTRYGSQVTLANRILSSRYWKDRKSCHIFLELEEVSRRVICHDLENDGSVLNKLLWNRRLLQALRAKLDGISGCWSEQGGGTWLFWGIDEKNRRYRLTGGDELLSGEEKLMLSGVDLDGNEHRFCLSRCELMERLQNRKLLPGLFMTFFSIGIARRSCLVGGCFQGDYLKDMCDGIKEAWKECFSAPDGETARWLDSLDKKEFPYLCGPLYLTGWNGGHCHPLSSVELWEHPLCFSEFKKTLKIRFERAQQIGLYGFYPDSVPGSLRIDNWWELIGEELGLING